MHSTILANFANFAVTLRIWTLEIKRFEELSNGCRIAL